VYVISVYVDIHNQSRWSCRLGYGTDYGQLKLGDVGSNRPRYKVQGGSNMTGTDLYVNKPHCAAAVRR